MRETIIYALKSRTVRTILLFVVFNLPYTQSRLNLDPVIVESANYVLGLAGIAFRIGAKKTLQEFMNEQGE
jgi:hypothetical protein